jgi:hypothetical protein
MSRRARVVSRRELLRDGVIVAAGDTPVRPRVLSLLAVGRGHAGTAAEQALGSQRDFVTTEARSSFLAWLQAWVTRSVEAARRSVHSPLTASRAPHIGVASLPHPPSYSRPSQYAVLRPCLGVSQQLRSTYLEVIYHVDLRALSEPSLGTRSSARVSSRLLPTG